jgi:hypothetical protein
MERETGIEPALVAWKATVLPLNYSRPNHLRPRIKPFKKYWKSFTNSWWREVDSNHRRHEPADLQSAPVGRLGIPPVFEAVLDQNQREIGRESVPPHRAAYCRFRLGCLSRRQGSDNRHAASGVGVKPKNGAEKTLIEKLRGCRFAIVAVKFPAKNFIKLYCRLCPRGSNCPIEQSS